ncbi:HPr kinase/phosphatase C-terminal domain-containing protein [Sphingomicrobium sp. XHP0235]|uniref:HPr kinase/phosphorylase n=1 Tax=Sphingomicrobium aquimarinum TaxID=3133971 RepID=UPI0031FE8A39
MSENIHATTVAKNGRATLLVGRSGAGKSDLALRLIDRGWTLVSDDRTLIEASDGHLSATPPEAFAGRIEVRGLGIVTMDYLPRATVALHVDLDAAPERMPMDARRFTLLGVSVPSITVDARAPSAPIIVELAFDGLETPPR